MYNTYQQTYPLKLVGQTSSKTYNTLPYNLDLINSNITIFTKNLKTYCSLLINNQETHILLEVNNIIKTQLQQLDNDQCNIEFEKVRYSLSEIEGYMCFNNLNGFQSILKQLFKFRMAAEDSDNFNKISIMIKGFIQQMGVIIQQEDQIINKLQKYDIYANNIINQDSEENHQNQNSQNNQRQQCHIEHINIGQLLHDAFNFINPPLHRLYIYEASKAYHDIVPIRLKNIMDPNIKMEERPKIQIENYFNCEEDKMIIGYPIANTKKMGYYLINEIQKTNNITIQSYKERQFNMKWKFSHQAQLLITQKGRIFGINCRDSLNADNYLYEFTPEKVVRRGQISKPRKQPGFICLNNNLYFIGGKEYHNQVTSKSYKYSIIEKKFTQIPNCNVAVRKPTICSFNNRFIFKLGGINEFDYISKVIEVYDTLTNKWSLVRASPRNIYDQVDILQDSIAVQINKQQIYVFGGVNRNGFKTDTGFVLTVTDICRQNNLHNIKVTGQLFNVSLGKRNLLSLFGVMHTLNVVIHHNCIYCLRKDICKQMNK